MKPKFSYKEIVRLTVAGGYAQREIAAAANCATFHLLMRQGR